MAMNVTLHGESAFDTITAPDGNTKPAPERVKVIKGSAGVANTGIVGTVYTYTYTGLGGTRQRIQCDPPIIGCTISVVPGADVAAFDEGVLYCFSAPTTGVADGWLTETNNGVPRHKIKPADGNREHYFDGATVTYIDIIGFGTGVDMDVTIEGVV